MQKIVSIVLISAAVTACSSSQPVAQRKQHYGVFASLAPKFKSRAVKHAPGRAPAAEGHGDEAPAKGGEANAVNYDALFSRQSTLLAALDVFGGKLRTKIGEARYQEIVTAMAEFEEEGEVASDVVFKAFRDAYVGEFPSEKDKIEGAIEAIVNQDKEISKALNADIEAKQFHAATLSYYQELSKGLKLPDPYTKESADAFYKAYMERAMNKMKKEKMSAGRASLMSMSLGMHMPELDFDTDKVIENLQAHNAEINEKMRSNEKSKLTETLKLTNAMAEQYKMNNLFGPMMRKQHDKEMKEVETMEFYKAEFVDDPEVEAE
jgi:hypothetical protein